MPNAGRHKPIAEPDAETRGTRCVCVSQREAVGCFKQRFVA